MIVLHLIELLCNETEDNAGSDECELRVWADDRSFTFRSNMNNGDSWPINTKINFEKRVKIQLWDLDNPGFPLYDDHDRLGTIIIRPTPIESAEGTFNEDGADYVLSYKITNE